METRDWQFATKIQPVKQTSYQAGREELHQALLRFIVTPWEEAAVPVRADRGNSRSLRATPNGSPAHRNPATGSGRII